MTYEKKNNYDVQEMAAAAANLYHAFTGQEPDEAMQKRIYAGVEGMLQLYGQSPEIAQGVAAKLDLIVDQYMQKELGIPQDRSSQYKLFESLGKMFKTGEEK